MSRLFTDHIVRRVASLNGLWNFRIDPTAEGEANGWFLGIPDARTIAVPSVWNEEKGLLDYEGVAWYSKSFYTRGGCLRLCFGAVMTFAKVWLDGEYLGSHYGAFSAFDFIVPEVSEGEHTVIVMADNRFDSHSIPQSTVDWYHYGGIIRNVEVETLDGICVIRNRLEYTLSEDNSSAECRLVLSLYNASNSVSDTKLTVFIDDKIVFEGKESVPSNEYKEVVLPAFTLTDIRLWDIGKPELYKVRMLTESDDLIDRVGFRRIEAKNKEILLNGRSIELRGVNRHEEYPGFGFAFPVSRMRADIDTILDVGCNAIRGSHYPNSREFVDYLDEIGVLFWSEIPVWGVGFAQETLGDPIVIERGLAMHAEMVRDYYNHPSIVIWGMHNEILSDTQEGLEMTKKFYSFLKANGGNRLVVYASHRTTKDISLAYTDVICLNVYHGWYYGGLSAWAPFLDEFCAYADSLGLSDVPIVFSEFGAAGIYGFHDTERTKWSEEFQAELLEHCLLLFHKHPSVRGTFVWQFCDIRTSPDMGFSRARGFNNKGILNEYRRPKAAYYAVKKCYTEFKKETNVD